MKMASFPRVVVLVCLVTMPRSVASQQTSSGSTSCTLDQKHRCVVVKGKDCHYDKTLSINLIIY